MPQDPEVLYPTAPIVGLADDVTINATPVTACAAYADKIDLERAAIGLSENFKKAAAYSPQGGLDCVPVPPFLARPTTLYSPACACGLCVSVCDPWVGPHTLHTGKPRGSWWDSGTELPNPRSSPMPSDAE